MAERHAGPAEDGRRVELGDIFFFYRPKVVGEHEAPDPHGEGDVQRFHIVLRRAGGKLFRLLTVGRKHLPDTGSHEREWGFVDEVAEEVAPIAEALRETTYPTKTRGVRRLGAARPAGEGAYALQGDGPNLFLTYRLELPETLGPVQREFNIVREAAYVVAVKNPEVANPPAIGLQEDDRVDYPAEVPAEFHGTRWSAGDKHLLDFPAPSSCWSAPPTIRPGCRRSAPSPTPPRRSAG